MINSSTIPLVPTLKTWASVRAETYFKCVHFNHIDNKKLIGFLIKANLSFQWNSYMQDYRGVILNREDKIERPNFNTFWYTYLKTIAARKTQFILQSRSCSNNANSKKALVLSCDSCILFITKRTVMIYHFLDNQYYVKNNFVYFKKC